MTRICPVCKREFSGFEAMRLVFDICPDCGATVVPKEGGEYDASYVTVFVSDERGEAEEVRRRLDLNKVSYVTRGDWESDNIYIDFLVKEDEAEKAAALLKDMIEKESVPEEAGPAAAEKEQVSAEAPPRRQAIFDQSQVDDEGSNKPAVLMLVIALLALIFIVLNYTVKK